MSISYRTMALELRGSLGMTQVEFAGTLGVAPTTVSRWETGRQIPSHLARKMLRELQSQKAIEQSLKEA